MQDPRQEIVSGGRSRDSDPSDATSSHHMNQTDPKEDTEIHPIRLRLGELATARGELRSESTRSRLTWADNRLTFHCPEGFPGDLPVGLALPLPEQTRAILWPAYFGHFERISLGEGIRSAFFSGAGSYPPPAGTALRLALPFCMFETSDELWLLGVDACFSCAITVHGSKEIAIDWIYAGAAGPHDETREFLLCRVASPAEALEKWHAWARRDMPQSPDWLRHIAFQNYDYLSNNGDGWFADIDSACGIFETPQERERAMFTLHGWYGQIGRYAYDPESDSLEESWEAMPLAQKPEFLQFDNGVAESATGVGAAAYRWRNLRKYHPVPMTWAGMRERLAHAKNKGFRTCLYILTGMQYPGAKEPGVAEGTALDIGTPLWKGPDNFGPTHLRNPLHPDVRKWALGYTKALIGKVGDLCDAFVVDETYYIPAGAMGPAACPGYADRAQLTLLREMHALCREHDIALLAADQLGLPLDFVDKRSFPYSLGCDGIYQDSAQWPDVYDAVRFPCWGRAALICNWAPKSNLLLQERAILKHGADLAWSNGSFGDDTGLGDLDAETYGKVKALWKLRMAREMEPSVPVKQVR